MTFPEQYISAEAWGLPWGMIGVPILVVRPFVSRSQRLDTYPHPYFDTLRIRTYCGPRHIDDFA